MTRRLASCSPPHRWPRPAAAPARRARCRAPPSSWTPTWGLTTRGPSVSRLAPDLTCAPSASRAPGWRAARPERCVPSSCWRPRDGRHPGRLRAQDPLAGFTPSRPRGATRWPRSPPRRGGEAGRPRSAAPARRGDRELAARRGRRRARTADRRGRVVALSPRIAGRIAGIRAMAGAVDVPGNIGAGHEDAEYNVWVDPVAADAVLRSGVPVTLVDSMPPTTCRPRSSSPRAAPPRLRHAGRRARLGDPVRHGDADRRPLLLGSVRPQRRLAR